MTRSKHLFSSMAQLSSRSVLCLRTLGVGALAVAIASCTTTMPTQSEASPSPTDTPTVAVDPSSVEAPTGEPAAEGQGHSVQAVTLVENLEHPWGMVWLPDGAMLVTERPGRLRIIRNNALEPNPVAGVPEVLTAGQGGLLDISLHPQFEDNGWVYFTYAHGTSDANRTRVARAQFDGSSLSNWTVIFEVERDKPGGQHFGSRMTWLPDETLLVAFGDGGNPPVRLDGNLIRNQAQNRNSRLGAVVRINDDGSIPADNPFANASDADPALWSYGHRNIQGLVRDPETNVVWSTEHGPRGGDELNIIEPGENYGWPVVTQGQEYAGGPVSNERSRPDMVDPLLVWTPSKAPSGLEVYRGDRFLQWRGHLFSGGLVTQDVRRIEVDAAGTVVAQESIEIGQRVRDVRQGPDGLLYVLTDESNGRLIRLEPTDG